VREGWGKEEPEGEELWEGFGEGDKHEIDGDKISFLKD